MKQKTLSMIRKCNKGNIYLLNKDRKLLKTWDYYDEIVQYLKKKTVTNSIAQTVTLNLKP